MCNLITDFQKYFEVVPADTPKLRKEAFKVRYQTICHDLKMPGYEPSRFPDGLETDEYDDSAVHSLLYHRSSGDVAGTLRLILSDANDINKPFPIERYAGEAFDPSLIDISKLPRATTAEISRMIIARRFRSRGRERFSIHGVDEAYVGNANDGKRRHFPHPILGLVIALILMSKEHNITHWYAVMEPVLNRLLRRFGLDLSPIGPIVDYHGFRRPHLDTVANVLTRAFHKHPAAWELVTDRGKVWPAPPVEMLEQAASKLR